MKRFSKISIDDIKNIQIDSGVLLKEFDVENPVFLPENVICVTSGGINPVCAPEYYDFGEDVDNAKTAKETKRIRGWNVSISFTTFTTSLALIRLALGAADISGKVLSLRQRLQYAKDFKDIWWVGKRADGVIVAIKLIRSLSDSGFSLQTTKRGKGKISITLKGHSSFVDKNKIPMEVYVIGEFNEPVVPDVPDEPVVPDTNSYLTFASAEPFTLATNNATKCWNGTLYTSTDAEAWNEWDGTTTLASAEDGGEHRLYLRGIGNSRISYVKPDYGYWILDGSGISCIGNIETLLDYKTVASGRHPTMWERCYYRMFYGCTSLVVAPELPATTLAKSCYEGMFYGCTSLVTAPKLPATTLKSTCYRDMFSGCTSLATAPELSATTLAEYCCQDMFYGCTSLVVAPELPTTTLAKSCYDGMFGNCTSLVTAPKLPATTLQERCYNFMFSGCTSLVVAPELSATTLAEYCCHAMFSGCTSLVVAPELPATTLVEYCYYRMFENCTSLVTAPKLPATTLASHCYEDMFSGCTSLVTAPELPATTLAYACYLEMFKDCTSLVTVPKLPATTLNAVCYCRMFEGCISLATLPELPATTLEIQCYVAMFSGCKNIKISTTQSVEYPNEYRIPTVGTIAEEKSGPADMFVNTGGTFTGRPTVNTTYYTSNTVI